MTTLMRGMLFPKKLALLAILLALGALPCVSRAAANDRGRAIEQFTGAPTRFVWLQDAGGGAKHLMGLDSRDDRGDREITGKAGDYMGTPLFTPRGDRVLFSRGGGKDYTIHIVNWAGGNAREFIKGRLVDVRADSRTGIEWVYYMLGDEQHGKPVRRCRLDDPAKTEFVWDKAEVSWNFRVSADATHAASLLPWPEAGCVNLTAQTWERFGGGCWTCMSPDNSYSCWVFDGPHRGVNLRVGEDGDTHLVDIHSAPGIDGWEVYHPRWANHVRFMTMTGPYKLGSMGGNNIGAGGPAVELYLGRFNESFTAIEAWLQVTHNQLYDCEGDAWIEGGAKAVLPAKARPNQSAFLEAMNRPVKSQQTWPGDVSNLEFLWQSASHANQIVDPASKLNRACRVVLRDKASFGRFGELQLAGGAAVAQDADAFLLKACRASNQLAIEAVITPDNVTQTGPARIVTFSTDAGSRNFSLAQDKDKLILRLRTPQTGNNGVNPELSLCTVAAGQTYHVIVSYFPGRLLCYVNGRQMLDSRDVKGDFSNWSEQHLLFGDEHNGERDWAGWLEGVAIYSRLIPPEEARMKYELYAARLKERKPAQRIVVEARLAEATPVPDPKSLAQYRRCLVVSAYDVLKVIEGKCEAKRLAAAQWGILDLKVQARVANRKIGQTYRLLLEPFGQQPQLQGERRAEDLADLGLPLFYDVER
jgi:hypothetical protein